MPQMLEESRNVRQMINQLERIFESQKESLMVSD